MAPGVGKTYQMLEEGHEEKDRGRDVVVGYLESHGRADTLAEAAGLEILPRRRMRYRDASLEELDLAGIIRRRPQLCLVDELAHTNVPGSGHDKRHQDVDAILAAGVDVYSTVNVQHVASLADQIAILTGIQVKETLPDRVLDDAHAVVLVDITPELLIERLEAGKIYPDRSVDAAQSGFFRPEKLTALRELSLLHVAEEAEPRGGSSQRVLILATPDPRVRTAIYHAFRAAGRLHAPLDVLWVRRAGEDTSDSDKDVVALERLVTTLGGTLLLRTGEDLVEIAAQVARERDTTYVVIGQPARRTRLGAAVHRDVPLTLMAALPGVDLQIVALPA